MSTATAQSFTGLDKLLSELQDLPLKIERNIYRGALRAGAKVIVDEAKRLVPIDSSDLRDSIRASVRVGRNNGKITANIKAGNKKAFYANFIEHGTVRHYIKASIRPQRLTRRGLKTISIKTLNKIESRGGLVIGGRFVGTEVIHPGSRKHPFMRPALDTKWRDAVTAFADYVRTRLPKEVGKLAR